MEYLPELLIVAAAHLLGAMSPGPDFALVTRNSLLYGKRTAIYTALGISLGIVVHVTYSLLGIGFIITKSILVYTTIKYLGAAYLIYLGYKALRSKKNTSNSNGLIRAEEIISSPKAIGLGFLNNVLNPKTTLFFLSLFTQIINPATPNLVQAIYGIEMVIMTFVWFAFLGTVLSHQKIKTRFKSVQLYLSKAFGAILVALGVKIATSE